MQSAPGVAVAPAPIQVGPATSPVPRAETAPTAPTTPTTAPAAPAGLQVPAFKGTIMDRPRPADATSAMAENAEIERKLKALDDVKVTTRDDAIKRERLIEGLTRRHAENKVFLDKSKATGDAAEKARAEADAKRQSAQEAFLQQGEDQNFAAWLVSKGYKAPGNPVARDALYGAYKKEAETRATEAAKDPNRQAGRDFTLTRDQARREFDLKRDAIKNEYAVSRAKDAQGAAVELAKLRAALTGDHSDKDSASVLGRYLGHLQGMLRTEDDPMRAPSEKDPERIKALKEEIDGVKSKLWDATQAVTGGGATPSAQPWKSDPDYLKLSPADKARFDAAMQTAGK